MTTQTKILIGIAALGAGCIIYKMYQKNKKQNTTEDEKKSNFISRKPIYKRPIVQQQDIWMCYNKDTDHGYIGFSPCEAGYEDITPKS